jgi:hypothetical protein
LRFAGLEFILGATRRDVRDGGIDIERTRMNDIRDITASAATAVDGVTQNLGGALVLPFVRYPAINVAIRQNRDWLRESAAQLRSRRLGIGARPVAFALSNVAQSQVAIDEPTHLESTRLQVQEVVVQLRLDEAPTVSPTWTPSSRRDSVNGVELFWYRAWTWSLGFASWYARRGSVSRKSSNNFAFCNTVCCEHP